MLKTSAPIRTGNLADLAFSVVVLAAYFTTYSSIQEISARWLIASLVLGVAYIAIGVYGYAYCVSSPAFWIKLVYFPVQLVLGLGILLITGLSGFNAMILLPLAGHSVVLLPEMWRYAVSAVVAIAYAGLLRFTGGSMDLVMANLPVFIAGQVFILVFTQMAMTEETSRREIQKLADDLAAANQSLRDFAKQVELLAIERERNRMAREIHDGLGHHLTAVNMQAKASRAVLHSDPDRAAELLENIESLSKRALSEVRQSVSSLRDTQLRSDDLSDRIHEVLATLENTGVKTRFEISGTMRPLSAETVLTLLRAVQETASNTIKHAGATSYTVELNFLNSDNVALRVSDDGVGSDSPIGGFGLIGIKERVNLLDGEYLITTSLGTGFMLFISLPG